jgi:glutathione-regulated potassium-efflux system ancillary protein KefG
MLAHPAYEKSRINRRLWGALQDLAGVTFHDLYEAYPEFDIDISREQALLTAADAVVLQHPFFWYSTPALVKQWEDLVLEHGWAYGGGGNALQGKSFLSVITTGGGQDAYHAEGHNRFSIRELLAPIEQTVRLCGMRYLSPFVVFGSHGMSDDAIARHEGDYRRVIEALRDGTLDLDAADQRPHLNDADVGSLIAVSET